MPFKSDRYEISAFSQIVKESNSYNIVCTKLNLASCNANRRTIDKYIKKYHLDVSHFTSLPIITHKPSQIKTIIEHLVIDSTINSSNLRKRLIKHGILKHQCDICGLTKWQDKEIILQLDHINGDHFDNRIENLRILCPNCHVQTDTYGKRKKSYKLPEQPCACGNKKGRKSAQCVTCQGLNCRKAIRPSKEELLELIKTTSFVQIGKMYGVTDNAVRKWCKDYSLPYQLKNIKPLRNSE